MSFSRLGDAGTNEYMENAAHIPNYVGDDHPIIDALIAMEVELDLMNTARQTGDDAAWRLHNAAFLTLTNAIDMYALSVDISAQPDTRRVLWVPKAPSTTRYAHIKEKFEGKIQKVTK